MGVQITNKFIAEQTGLTVETVAGLLDAGWTLIFEAGKTARWEQPLPIAVTQEERVEGAPDLHWVRRTHPSTIIFEPGAIVVAGDRDPRELAQEILDEIQNEGRPRR